MITFTLPPQKKNANDPREARAFQEALPRVAAEGSSFSINFYKDLHHPRRANVAWLRHAYLALFAIAGYRYIFRPGLGIVRKQIKKPDEEHIPVFLAHLPGEHPWSERHIISVRQPKSLQSWAVQFGRYVAFLRSAGDTEFYARMAEDARLRGQSRITGVALRWPTEPLFGLDSA
jgi:hypothetical protein